MQKLKVVSMGDAVQGVHLLGNRRNPEPVHFRVTFPGGDVDVVRTTDDEYWIHVYVHHHPHGQIVDARLDIAGRHTSDVKMGDFGDPKLYHLAVRVGLK